MRLETIQCHVTSDPVLRRTVIFYLTASTDFSTDFSTDTTSSSHTACGEYVEISSLVLHSIMPAQAVSQMMPQVMTADVSKIGPFFFQLNGSFRISYYCLVPGYV